MDFSFSEEQQRIREAIGKLCARFGDDYWLAREYHVERYLRESFVGRIAPVSPQMILCFIAERVLGLPKSY